MKNTSTHKILICPRGVLQWIFTIFSFMLLALTAFILFYMVHPSNVYNPLSFIATATSIFPFLLLIALGVIILFALLALWRKANLAVAANFIAVLLLCSTIVYQFAGMLSLAQRENVPVSLFQNYGWQMLYKDLPKLPMTNVIYETAPDGTQLVMDIWPAQSKNAGDPSPAIVKIHGGGWVAGERNAVRSWNQWLNSLGYTVFDIEYRLAPPVRWKDEVGDVKTAIGWVWENADKYGIDRDRISLMGESAGGNLALLAAYTMGNDVLPPSVGNTIVPIKSVINIYGPCDLTALYEKPISKPYIHDVLGKYIGGSTDEYGERYKTVSPINYVAKKVPPTITFQGTIDRVVPMGQAEELDKAMADAGAYHELHLLPGADHVYDINVDSLASQYTRAKLEAFLKKYS